MNSTLMRHVKKILQNYRRKKTWQKVVTVMAAVVVFITTYMLILPAITMEANLVCEKEEHTHTEECYETQPEQRELTCTKESLNIHQHTGDCYDANGVLICGYADYVVHTHDENCNDAEGNLVCTLPEVKEHTHTDGCYNADGELICDQPEVILHEHIAGCYNEDGNLICGKLETKKHQHTDDCFTVTPETKELICENEEHVHTEECYNDAEDQNSGENGIALLAEGDESVNTGNIPVTSISGSGTTYDASKDIYTSDLKIEFSFNKKDIDCSKIYVYQYPEGIIVPDSLVNQMKDLYDNEGVKAGTYQFVKNEDGTYSVQIKFDGSYVQNAGETISGYVEFSGEIDASKVDENGNIVVGGDDLQLIIPSNKITYPSDETNCYDIDVSKNGSYVVDGNKLVYTVYVRTYKGTPDPIHFTDTITANGLTLGTPTVTVEKGYRYYSSENAYYDGDTFETVSVRHTYDENGKIEMSLNGLTQEIINQNNQDLTKIGFYKVTYTYDITGMDVTEISSKNKVTVSAEDGEKGQTVTDEAETTVNINKNHSMSKSGWYDSSTGKIKWTITINENGANIAGAELTDKMLGELSDENAITISPSNEGYEVEKDSNGKITGIKFKAIGENDVNTNKYTITYYTEVESSWDDQKITNNAIFDPTPSEESSGDEITGEASVNVVGGSVAKSMDGAEISEDGKTAEVTWTVTLTVPESGLPAGTVIEDDVTKNQWGNVNSYSQWMTRSQVTAWACNLYWKDSNGEMNGGTNTYTVPGTSVTFLASDGNRYNYEQINENQTGFADSLTFTIFTITLDQELKPPAGSTQLYFTYKTTVDLESAGIGSNTYSNSVKVGDKSAGAEYVYHKAGVRKTDGNNQTGTTSTSSDGIVTWKIVATMDDQDRKKLTLIDKLPDGVTLEKLQLTGWGNLNMELIIDENGTISGTDSTNQYNVNGEYTNNQVTLNITPYAENGTIQNNSEFTLTVTCKVNDAGNQTETKTFTNNAEMKLDNAEIGSSEQTQNWTYETTTVGTQVVDKSGVWDNDNRRLNYSIVLNPEGKDLVEGTDVLTLIDELNYYPKATVYNSSPQHDVTVEVTLIQSSVKLYKAIQAADGTWTKGEEIKDWSWTYGSKKAEYTDNIIDTLTGSNIPDGVPLILEYAYAVHSSAEEKDNFSFSANNTAKLEGTSYQDSAGSNQEQWKEQSSSAGITTEKSFTLYKVEAGNYKNNLEGAVFSVYEYDSANNKYKESKVTTYTTDSKGMLQIKWDNSKFQYNILYKVVETQPPTGYKLPDTVKEYYFYFSSETDTTNTLPSDLPNTAVDLSKSSHTVYAENVKNSTEIAVDKKWFKSDGETDITNTKGGSISFDLYQITSTIPPSESSGSESGGSIGESGSGVAELKFSVQGTLTDDNNLLSETYSKSAGTTVTLVIEDCYGDKAAPTVRFNDSALTTTVTDGTEWIPSWGGEPYTPHIYTYTFNLVGGSNSVIISGISWNSGDWKLVSLEFSESAASTDPDSPESVADDEGDAGGDSSNTSTTPSGTLYGTYTIYSANDWIWSKDDLPLTGKDDDGNTVYYTYYVVEHDGTNYSTAYENNNGIVSGTITIKNTESDNPIFVLPETGGSGTIKYIMGGILLMLASVLLYIKQHIKEGRRKHIRR